MKCIIRTKLISIFVILTSIHFIYSGCCGDCCVGEGSKSGNKSNSKGKPSSPDTGGKPGYIPAEGDKPEKIQVVETPEDKKKKEEEGQRYKLVGAKIKTYLEKRDGNRTNIKDKFNFTKSGEFFVIKYIKFVGHIKIVDTNTINDKSGDDVIGNLNVEIRVDSYKENKSYTFNDNKCTLEQLVKSLNTLNVELRADLTEYLCVLNEDENGKYVTCINLKNGIIYSIQDCKSGTLDSLMRDSLYSNYPLYCKGIFYSIKSDVFTPLEDQKKAAEEFNKPLPDNDISKYNLTIACEY